MNSHQTRQVYAKMDDVIIKTGFKWVPSPPNPMPPPIQMNGGDLFLTPPQLEEKRRLANANKKPAIDEKAVFDNDKAITSGMDYYQTMTPHQCLAVAHHTLVNHRKVQKPSIYTMELNDIVTFLGHGVLYQIDACMTIAETLKSALTTDLYDGDNNKPYTITLTGPTGVGKSQLAKELRTLLRMNQGDYNQLAYAEYRCGQMDKETMDIAIKGIVPTIEMSESHCNARVESLYAKLVKASNHYKQNGDKLLVKESKHFILLFFDEIDKADKYLMKSLNSLLADGTMDSRTGQSQYKVPSDTRLIIIMTANFGAKAIVANRATSKQSVLIKEWTLKEMKERGYEDWDISRLGEIQYCLPPEKEALVVILARKVFDYFTSENEFTKQYGFQPNFLNKELINFIDYIVERCDPYNGIRDAINVVHDILNAFTLKNIEFFKHDVIKFGDVREQLLAERPNICFDKVLEYDAGIHVRDLFNKIGGFDSIFDDDINKTRILRSMENNAPIAFLILAHPSFTYHNVSVLKYMPICDITTKKDSIDDLITKHLERLVLYFRQRGHHLTTEELQRILKGGEVCIPSVSHPTDELDVNSSNESDVVDQMSRIKVVDNDESLVVPQRGTKRKQMGDCSVKKDTLIETSRVCNVCNMTKDMDEFILSNSKTVRQCKSCRKKKNAATQREKRAVDKSANK